MKLTTRSLLALASLLMIACGGEKTASPPASSTGNAPIKLHDTPIVLTRGPAEVGEHTREVLAEGGWSAAEIDALIAAGAAATERTGAPA